MSTSSRLNPELVAVRLFFPLAARAAATRFWHRMSAPALGQHLLHAARRAHIQQAVMHHIASGYLAGGRLSHMHPDGTSHRHPQCIELIDTETKLRKFLHDHADEIEKVRVVMYRCEVLTATAA